MFPNVRLMIVAIMASILGISCGLGVFAVFRVNHDPFARLPNLAPPLQLASGTAALMTLTDSAPGDSTPGDSAAHEATAAPFGARFQVSVPHSAGAGAPQLATVVPPQADLPPPAPVNAAAEATPAPEAQASGNAPEATQDSAGQAAIQSATPALLRIDRTVQDTNSATESAKLETAKLETAKPENAQPEHANAAAGKTARAAVKRQRLTRVRRVRRARARGAVPPADQSSGFSQPAYQFTPVAQSRPVHARRAAKNSAARSATQ